MLKGVKSPAYKDPIFTAAQYAAQDSADTANNKRVANYAAQTAFNVVYTDIFNDLDTSKQLIKQLF